MAIVMVGAPASGKTTVGTLVAQRLGLPFVDVDAAIEAETGRTIPELFVDHGEPFFRDLERTATLNALDLDAVVSLGGGAVLDEQIRAALTAGGHDVVWLQVSVVHATRRVGMNVMRPLLLGDVRANLERLLTEREPFYREVATLVVDTATDKPDQIADRVVEQVGRR